MKQNLYLKIAGMPSVLVDKDYFTVGKGPGFDLTLASTRTARILFSISRTSEGDFVIPGEDRVELNGKAIKKPTALMLCDRLQGGDITAVVVDADTPKVETSQDGVSSAVILKDLNASLDRVNRSRMGALPVALAKLMDYAGAECGALVCESDDAAAWELVAYHGNGADPSTQDQIRKTLVSHTILAEAIEKRVPVYVESIIGHRWEAQASILENQLYSVACVPLLLGERVFGALLLYTRTPGHSIVERRLEAISIAATQTALLYSAYRSLEKSKETERSLKRATGQSALTLSPHDPQSLMNQLSDRLTRLAQHDLSILVRGETGTGKELIAQEIHRRSSRKNGPFVALNCAAIPPTLMESILFGYAKGAFTGANKDKAGKFVQANGGTLFLDEIGDLSSELQTKLLRVLQEKEVEPVGGEKSVKVDVRIVSATHQDLERLSQDGKFRSDLFYRLNGATLQVPSLRERGPQEILHLAAYFLKRYGDGLEFSEQARLQLLNYSWPGNVRELEQTIRRAIALATSQRIEVADLELPQGKAVPAAVASSNLPCGLGPLKDVQEEFTRAHVARVLEKFSGNREQAAQSLEISERTLYRLLANDKTDSPDKVGSRNPDGQA